VFPSAGDRHPTLTVLAHALRVARDVQIHLIRGVPQSGYRSRENAGSNRTIAKSR
jgi:hypothetical protein